VLSKEENRRPSRRKEKRREKRRDDTGREEYLSSSSHDHSSHNTVSRIEDMIKLLLQNRSGLSNTALTHSNDRGIEIARKKLRESTRNMLGDLRGFDDLKGKEKEGTECQERREDEARERERETGRESKVRR
jgi:hypothetical protein